jgi:hypothetical protein
MYVFTAMVSRFRSFDEHVHSFDGVVDPIAAETFGTAPLHRHGDESALSSESNSTPDINLPQPSQPVSAVHVITSLSQPRKVPIAVQILDTLVTDPGPRRLPSAPESG